MRAAALAELPDLDKVYNKLEAPPEELFPLVSVLTSTFCTVANGRLAMLERAFTSLIAQTFRNFEVILVDDGSDQRQQVAELALAWGKKFAAVGINLLFKPLPYNTGSNSTPFNMAIQISNAAAIAYLDDDNEWDPNHLEVLVDMIRTPGNDLVYGFHRVVAGEPYSVGYDKANIRDETGALRLWYVEFDPVRLQKGPTANRIDLNSGLHSRGAAVEQLLRCTGAIWKDNLMRFNDWEMLSRWARQGLRGLAIDKVITTMHAHADSATTKRVNTSSNIISAIPAEGSEAWLQVRHSLSKLVSRVSLDGAASFTSNVPTFIILVPQLPGVNAAQLLAATTKMLFSPHSGLSPNIVVAVDAPRSPAVAAAIADAALYTRLYTTCGSVGYPILLNSIFDDLWHKREEVPDFVGIIEAGVVLQAAGWLRAAVDLLSEGNSYEWALALGWPRPPQDSPHSMEFTPSRWSIPNIDGYGVLLPKRVFTTDRYYRVVPYLPLYRMWGDLSDHLQRDSIGLMVEMGFRATRAFEETDLGFDTYVGYDGSLHEDLHKEVADADA